MELTLYCCSLNPGCYNTIDINGEHAMRGVNNMPPSGSLVAPSRGTPQTHPAQKWNSQYTSPLFRMIGEGNQTRQKVKYEWRRTLNRLSGCRSITAAAVPMLALSVFALTTSSKSSALSIPVAWKLSTTAATSALAGAGIADPLPFPLPLGVLAPVALAPLAPKPPPAASAPGPAGFGTAAAGFFDEPAFGALGLLPLLPIAASSSASRRAASALRAAAVSLRAFSSATRGFSDFEPCDHFVASRCSYIERCNVAVSDRDSCSRPEEQRDCGDCY